MSDEICNDLMANIFKRLPLKSIIRFRSLSKYWHSRIASQEFIRSRTLRYSKTPPKVLIRHLTYCGNYTFKDIYTLHSADQLPLDPSGPDYTGIPGVEFPYRHLTTEIIGSCNGIICLCDDKNISLWNLSIRRRLNVSYPPRSNSSPNRHLTYGFGFDPITDDYKIVSTSYNKHESDENNTFIYSLKTDSWSAIPSPSTPYYWVESKACFFNGILRWVVKGNLTTEPTIHWSSFILTFDLSSNVFGNMLLPQEDGCYGIQVMEEYGKTESWSELFKLESKSYLGANVYNPQTRSYTKLLEFGPDCYKAEMDMYVESLELLDKERATTCGKTIFSWTKKGHRKRTEKGHRKKIKLSRVYSAFMNNC